MRVAAVILAAGEGRRLGGVAKAALVLPGGATFVAAIIAAAREAGCRRTVVVAAEPHLDATRAAAEAAGADEVVVNPEPSRQMASSLAVGLEAVADADAVLAWPVDHARVAPETVRLLIAAVSRAGIVVPVFAGRGGHPTAFGADLFDELRGCAAFGGARAVIARTPERVTRLLVDDEGVVRDVDVPTDLPSCL